VTDVEEIKMCIVREKCLAYRTEKDAMKQPKVAHMPLDRSTELGREVYAATVAHTPLAHPTESEKCMQPPKGSAHASQFLDSAFQT
jgi:hypothetical protein